MMDELEAPGTRDRILDAAFTCFARSGFAGTSMVDIAAASGLSRTALYKHFPAKEEVFLAAVQRLNAGVLAAVTAAAAKEGSLADRLAAVIEARASWAFELLQRSPHGRELIDEKNRLCGPLSAEANARFLSLVERIIRAGLAGLPGSLPPRQAAALLVDAASGVLRDESSEASAQRRLRQLAAVFAAGLAGRRSDQPSRAATAVS